MAPLAEAGRAAEWSRWPGGVGVLGPENLPGEACWWWRCWEGRRAFTITRAGYLLGEYWPVVATCAGRRQTPREVVKL